MVKSEKIKGLMAENNLTIQDMANAINCVPKTFSTKLEKRCFTTDEAMIMIKVLHIEDPGAIFFAAE